MLQKVLSNELTLFLSLKNDHCALQTITNMSGKTRISFELDYGGWHLKVRLIK